MESNSTVADSIDTLRPPGASALDDAELDRLLREDVPYLDLTTAGLELDALSGRITFAARAPMVTCGLEEAARLFERRGARCEAAVPRGRPVSAQQLLLVAYGSALALHQVWKTAQTLVEVASGIASATAAIVTAVRGVGKDPAVVTTRKNFPGTRALASLAARAGGATAHRLGLSETLLVFPEHRAFLPAPLVGARLQALKRRHLEKKLVVEVLDVAEALAMARAGADVLQLEKFAPAEVARTGECLRKEALSPLLAVAGGVSVHNAADYARAGADILVTSAPYWATPGDVKVVLGPA
jgi:molybdenum transport protein